MDIGSLPDEDLRCQLQELGVNVGPIVSSTRLFYEKKLGKLLQSGDIPQEPEPEESEEEEEEEEEDQEVYINYKKQTEIRSSGGAETETRYSQGAETRPVIKPQFTSTPNSQTNYSPVIQARVATPTQAVRRNVPSRTVDRPPPVTTEAETQQGGGGLSMLLKLLFVVSVAFLVYLVIINMNPSAEDKIPLSLDEN